MSQHPVEPIDEGNVEDVVAQCSVESDTSFGIRVERHDPGSWVATSSYRVARRDAAGPPTAGQARASDRRRVSGSVSLGPTYRGCPFCRATGLVVCGCGEMACFAGRSGGLHMCPWCGSAGLVEGEITGFGVTGGSPASDQTDPPADDLMETRWWEA
jgi:hypothetical protein